MKKKSNKVQRLGIVSEGELQVEFFPNEASLLNHLKLNDIMAPVGYFDLPERLNDSLNKTFKDREIAFVSFGVKIFPKELEHFDWYPRD